MRPLEPAAFSSPSRRGWQRLALAFLVGAVFVTDTVTSFEIAAAVFYVAAILLGVGLFSTRGVIGLAVLCACLTLISFTLSRFGEHGAGIVNLAISISALATTTFLALRIVAAEAAAHEARAQLGRLAGMASFGALTASIAHEVNQPLAAIVASGNAGLRWLGQAPPRLDKAEAALSRIVADANRASEIIGNLRRLARGELSQKVPVDLNVLLRETAALAKAELERNQIDIVFALAEDGLSVLADPVQIQQVVGNLLLNALEAIKQASGPLPRRIFLSSESAGDNVVVTIADSGVGLPNAGQEQLFSAFWTTKQTGIGMGLTICRSIVEAHGGSMGIAPNRPAGARVMFSLPAPKERRG